jgi:patatin-like phospholipase domain-containing protein 2
MCESKDLNLTFSGCGFLGIYHLGVVSCLKDNAPAFLDRVKYYGGTSAGAFAATAILMDLNVSDSAEFVLRLAKRAKSLTLGPLHPNFRIVNTVRKSFEKILPENAHEIASGRLHVSLTRISDFKNVIVSEFLSKEDLIEVSLSLVFIYSLEC